MNHDRYKQERLNAQKPFKQAPLINAIIELSIEKQGTLVNLTMTQIDRGVKILEEVDGRYFLNIENDSLITFLLCKKTMWRWSDSSDGITTKEPLSDFYGYIRYSKESDTHIFEEKDVCIDGKTETSSHFSGYRAMSFLAKLDRFGVPGRNHGFNLNVEFKQAKGGWLPVTIDPDMKNPPPGPH